MAMNATFLRLVHWTIDRVRMQQPERRLKTVALGYPDLIATRKELREVFPALPEAAFVLHPDSDAIARRHGVGPAHALIYDSDPLLKALGLDVDYIDIEPSRGIERRVDLNEAIPTDMINQYDLVIDTGTLEHCFNVGQAFKNVADMVTLQGAIVQAAPLNRFNHGFWNFSPTAYHDYYHDNGFSILYLMGWAGNVTGQYLELEVPRVNLFYEVPQNAVLVCVAQKTEQRPHQWPTQWKYRRHA